MVRKRTDIKVVVILSRIKEFNFHKIIKTIMGRIKEIDMVEITKEIDMVEITEVIDMVKDLNMID